MRPPFLQQGDIVHIVSPAANPDRTLLEKACEIIRAWGLQVSLAPHAIGQHSQYLAAEDNQRLEDLQYALDAPNLKAIFCARGGHGTTRIIDQLDFSRFVNAPKWIIGFSDITAIHLKMNILGIESMHACMPVQFNDPHQALSVESLKNALMGNGNTTLTAIPCTYNRTGKAKGIIVGGNLSLIVNSLGTTDALETDDKILVIEDVGEPLYKIDRMMTQLQRARKLEKICGLVVGHFSNISSHPIPFHETCEQIIASKVDQAHFPLAFGLPTGHASPNLPWINGAVAQLEVTPTHAKLIVS